MPAPAMAQDCAKLGLRVAAALAFLPPLLTRLVMGQAFYMTGHGKLEHLDNTVKYFADLGIPFATLNAAFVSRLEFYGGMLLILGLGTRVVAALLSSTMIVALLTAEKANFLKAFFQQGEAGLTDIVPFAFLMFLLWLVFYGPGLLSLDTLLARWLGLRPSGTEGG